MSGALGHCVLLVGLKIPDTTAITTFHAFQDLGFTDIIEVRRWSCYEFDYQGRSRSGNSDRFEERISKVDILVNANKNTSLVIGAKEDIPKKLGKGLGIILVRDLDKSGQGLLKTLRDRLGFHEITGLRQGVLWGIGLRDKVPKGSRQEVLRQCAQTLLYNKHYQTYQVIG